MLYNNYINSDFTDYINRYCEEIIQFKDQLKKVSLFFELPEAFSNYSCRFYIDVDFYDLLKLFKITLHYFQIQFPSSMYSMLFLTQMTLK